MEENTAEPVAVTPVKHKMERQEVITVRNWKEYLGESLLIVFSVALAILLTEVFTKLREDHVNREVLHQLKEELISNKAGEQVQYAYHLKVLRNIDSALHTPSYAQQFIHDGEQHLNETIAPDGILKFDLIDIAWQIARQNNVVAKLDLKTYSLLADIYNQQERIKSTEQEIGHLLLSFESRKPENLRTALILVRDNYHGWSVDRAPSLIEEYGTAIEALSKY